MTQSHVIPPTRLGFALRTLPAALLLLPFGYLASSAWGLDPSARFAASLLVSSLLAVMLLALSKHIWRLCTSSIGATAIPTHHSADRQLSLSHVESLIASGQHDVAATEIERLLAEHGVADAGLCHVAVNYYLRAGGDVTKGEALLRRMRSERPNSYEHIATRRLIDLLMRDPSTATRAIPELHRLAQLSPGTAEAAGAVNAIAGLRRLVCDSRIANVKIFVPASADIEALR